MPVSEDVFTIHHSQTLHSQMKSTLAIATIFLSISLSTAAQHLPQSTPEEQGISSAAISKFIDATATSKTEFHSFILLRHGKVVAQGWWNPYGPDLKHTLYSCSKSFTATAVGFALSEKLLSLDDKVISFFPNEVPDTISANLADLTVKDVLMMSDGQRPDPTFAVASRDSNWVKGFLNVPVLEDPGTTFLYNSLGTYMLSAIVQKVSGMPVLEYLKPRLFDPLGITGMDWESDSRGINTGGWGLRLKTEDMAKFAQLFLQKGMWNGKQVLPAGWAEEASTVKIMQDPTASQSKKDSSDWLQGYCYQMWRCRHNAYRGDGAYGQYMIVMPEQDAALAITAETTDMQEEINLVWEHLLPAFKDGKLPANKKAYRKLQQQLESLSVAKPAKAILAVKAPSTKTYQLEQNPVQLKTFSIKQEKGVYTVTTSNGKENYALHFAPGKWQVDKTSLPGPSLTAGAIEKADFLYPAKVAGSYAWKQDNTLQLELRYIESPHRYIFTCHFDGNKLSMDVEKSNDSNGKVTVHGVAQ